MNWVWLATAWCLCEQLLLIIKSGAKGNRTEIFAIAASKQRCYKSSKSNFVLRCENVWLSCRAPSWWVPSSKSWWASQALSASSCASSARWPSRPPSLSSACRCLSPLVPMQATTGVSLPCGSTCRVSCCGKQFLQYSSLVKYCLIIKMSSFRIYHEFKMNLSTLEKFSRI